MGFILVPLRPGYAPRFSGFLSGQQWNQIEEPRISPSFYKQHSNANFSCACLGSLVEDGASTGQWSGECECPDVPLETNSLNSLKVELHKDKTLTVHSKHFKFSVETFSNQFSILHSVWRRLPISLTIKGPESSLWPLYFVVFGIYLQ